MLKKLGYDYHEDDENKVFNNYLTLIKLTHSIVLN
jgi:hypothetical protein